MHKTQILRALGALAHEVRLDVFRQLVIAGPSGLTPKTLSDTLKVPPTKLSFHLKELAHAGLVTQEQDGRHLIYRAAYDAMDGVIGYLNANCCRGVVVACETADGTCSSC